MTDTPRYLLVWDRMGDYHVARWRALQRRIGAGNAWAADLHAADSLYGWQMAWGRDPHYVRLSDKGAADNDVAGRVSRFIRLVRGQNITHVALAGYGRTDYRLMAAYARMAGRHVTLFAESWYPSTRPWQDKLKGRLVSALGHTFLVSGERAARHFSMNLGIAPSRITAGYSVVDNAHFASAERVGKPKVMLCVARFAPEKNLPRLVEAFAQSSLPAKGWELKLVGGGPEHGSLSELANRFPWLRLQPWLSYAELPPLYASAGAFVLPSLFEPWGLVVNEALASGLPVAVSHEVGALPDLLGEDTPYRFSALDVKGMATVLDLLAEAPTPSHDRIGRFTPDTWAEALIRLGARR